MSLPLFSLLSPALLFKLLSAGCAQVTSDGSASRPHVSWTNSPCSWTSLEQAGAASALCHVAGYDRGAYVTASNDPCQSSFTGGSHYHFSLDSGLASSTIHGPSSPETEAQITATCCISAGTYVRVSSGSCTSQGHAAVTSARDCHNAAFALHLSDNSVSPTAAHSKPSHCVYAANDWLAFNSWDSNAECGTSDGHYVYDCICKVLSTGAPTSAPSTLAPSSGSSPTNTLTTNRSPIGWIEAHPAPSECITLPNITTGSASAAESVCTLVSKDNRVDFYNPWHFGDHCGMRNSAMTDHVSGTVMFSLRGSRVHSNGCAHCTYVWKQVPDDGDYGNPNLPEGVVDLTTCS